MKNWAMIGSLWLSAMAMAAPSTYLYVPNRSIKEQGIQVKGWGSGSIAETDETAYQGVNSIRISTRNFYQGGRIMLATPVDLTEASADKANLLQFVIKIADSSMTMGGGAGGGKTGGLGAGGSSGGGGAAAGEDGGPGGPGGPGDGRRGGGPGGGRGGAGAGGDTAAEATPVLKNLRLIVTTSDNKKSEIYFPLAGAPGENGWRSVAVPIQAISGFMNTDKKIKEIALAGDATSTFYIGEVKTINDTTPISGTLNVTEVNLALGDELELIGNGFGGASQLTYQWDFDASDGIQVDREGQYVRRRFRKAGTYTITLTISDAFGLKPSYTRTAKVTVNP